MVDRAIASTWGIIDGLIKAWPVAVGIVMLIGYCYSISARVTDDHSTIESQGALLDHLLPRVQTLEDDQKNDSANNSQQFQSLGNQLSSLASKEDEIANTLAGESQLLAAQGERIKFLVSKDYPNTGSGP
jgi:hypothetical protein